MAGQVTDNPPFEIPNSYKKATRWAERRVPDGYSDGDQRHWPPAPLYRPSPQEFYLCVLGQQWAEQDGIAQPGVQYYIDKLPDGYAMFETPQPSGPQTYRRLFGHPKGRFYDSAVRFAPHFLWLMSGMEGECKCVHCARKSSKPIIPRPRAPREVIDRPVLLGRLGRSFTDDDDGNDTSRTSSTAGGIANKRTQRQVRQAATQLAVDEEGSEDIYKDCVKRLENARDGTNGIEIDLTEDGSIDWKAERESLPRYLTQIEQQHCFIPRIGELVLWFPDFLDQHYLMLDQTNSQFKFYSFDQRCFHGFPAWRAGIVATAPSASIKNGPIDFPDLLDTPKKKTSFNTAGFRIETMSDPNDDVDKSLSKQYKYVPLRNIRPLSHWQMLLNGIPQNKLHSSIQNALTCMTSLSLLEKWRFNGDWPRARIFCKGAYLGPELITVGDTIRLIPSKNPNELQPDVLIVESIRYNLLDLSAEHAKPDNPHFCGSSYVSFVGPAYTTDLKKLENFRSVNSPGAGIRSRPFSLATSEVKKLFRSVGAEEYGSWYAWHGPLQRYEISHEQVAGRLYEADAVRLWTGQRQNPLAIKAGSKAKLDFDIASVQAGRLYATATDARLPDPQSNTDINWFLADTRVEALAVATINGVDVGRYHDIRTPPTLKQWRMQVKVADGQSVAPEVVDEYIKDLSQIQLYTGARRGRPLGSKLVDGKLVKPGQYVVRGDSKDAPQEKYKPTSQMAGAALATDEEDSSEVEYTSGDTEDDVDAEETVDRHARVDGPSTAGAPKQALSKAAIMSSIEVPEDGAFDDDVSDDDEDWLAEPLPPLRGGTEESEGGDYHE